MSIVTRLLAFGATLVALVGVGYGVGAAVGPAPATTSAESMTADSGEHSSMESAGASPEVAGLASNDQGLRLDVDQAQGLSGMQRPVAFRITAADGDPLTAYEIEHEKPLHLIAVRRDLSGFQHVHPTMAVDGTWSTALDLAPGTWRVFADFVPGGWTDGVTLGADLSVAGAYEPSVLPDPATTVSVKDLTVALTGAPQVGVETTLSFAVSRNGGDVRPERYLGARGHLVVLREGDLGYIHVHADEDVLSFEATFPAPGRYALFLEVSVDDEVVAVPFTVEVPE